MIAALVVQEGNVLLVSGGPATRAAVHLVLAALLPETRLPHVLHGDVVVAPVARALAAAVAEQHRLVALVAEAQLAHGHLQLPQGAGFGPPGSFSPARLVLIQAPALLPLPVQQGLNHMLQLALCEALEHHGD